MHAPSVLGGSGAGVATLRTPLNHVAPRVWHALEALNPKGKHGSEIGLALFDSD